MHQQLKKGSLRQVFAKGAKVRFKGPGVAEQPHVNIGLTARGFKAGDVFTVVQLVYHPYVTMSFVTFEETKGGWRPETFEPIDADEPAVCVECKTPVGGPQGAPLYCGPCLDKDKVVEEFLAAFARVEPKLDYWAEQARARVTHETPCPCGEAKPHRFRVVVAPWGIGYHIEVF